MGESGRKFEGPVMSEKDQDAPRIDKHDAPAASEDTVETFRNGGFHHVVNERVGTETKISCGRDWFHAP